VAELESNGADEESPDSTKVDEWHSTEAIVEALGVVTFIDASDNASESRLLDGISSSCLPEVTSGICEDFPVKIEYG
jgi:hypothetical protein